MFSYVGSHIDDKGWSFAALLFFELNGFILFDFLKGVSFETGLFGSQ